MEKLQPRAVIFDLGSTLIEYEAIPWPELNLVCLEKAYEFLVKKKIEIPEKEPFCITFFKSCRSLTPNSL